MDKIEFTPEYLADLKTKAEKALPGNTLSNSYEDDCWEFLRAARPSVVLALLALIDDLRSEILAYQAGCETIRCPRAKEFSDEN